MSTMQVRLTDEEAEFVQRRAQHGKTRSDVMREAITCLRNQEIKALMLEGYRECADLDYELAEAAMGAQAEALPEW